MKENLVSIIIPMYNAQKYIRKTLESILNQEYKNFEILLVNDGSTDNSIETIEDLVKNNSQIEIINKENSGPSDSRNLGIQKAKGSYITFVDSDDYIHTNFLKILMQKALDTNADIVMCGFWEEYLDGEDRIKKQIENRLNDEVIKKRSKSILDFNQSMIGYVWNKLYRAEIIRSKNISFPTGIDLYEDIFFNEQVFKNANIITFISNLLYYYTQRDEESLVKKYIENEFELTQKAIKSKTEIMNVITYNKEAIQKVENELYINAIKGIFSKINKNSSLNKAKKIEEIEKICIEIQNKKIKWNSLQEKILGVLIKYKASKSINFLLHKRK